MRRGKPRTLGFMDWTRASIWSFIRGPVLRTPEGWAFAVGTMLCLSFGTLGWLAPETVSTNPGTATGQALLFSIWPLALFTAYIMFCAPDFRPALFTTIVMLCSVAFPFWMVYGP